jgi:hypothetical protein
MSTDIFDFWSKIGPRAQIHPSDDEYFKKPTIFEPDMKKGALPGAFMGPLRSARVVLLATNAGVWNFDMTADRKKKIADWHVETRKGNEPLPCIDINPETYGWWTQKAVLFAPGRSPQELRSKMAFLSVVAYHSKKFDGGEWSVELPSSRVSVEWANDVLFERARKKECVVVCAQARKHWIKSEVTGHLFAPNITYWNMHHKKPADEAIRTRVMAAIREALQS